jgi:cell division protein FtsQ
VSSRLLSPRSGGRTLTDYGQRSALLARQRVGHVRRPRPERRGRARRALVALAAVLAILAGGAAGVRWLLTSERFAIRSIEVRGASRLAPEQVVAATGLAAGTNLWRVNPDAVVGRLQAIPEVRRAEIIRELPNRLTVVIEERRPFTLVASARLHWLDEDGRLLGEAGHAVAPAVPVISGLTDEELAAMRTAPSPRARAAVTLIRTLLRAGSALAGEISEIDMSRREGPVLYTVDGIEVRLGSEDWAERLARLEGVLAQVAAQGEPVRTIDLRFRDQVVLQKGGQG